MAYRYGDRNQIALFPAVIEDYVEQDAPVRAYDAVVETFDFNELGIDLDFNKVGNSNYDSIEGQYDQSRDLYAHRKQRAEVSFGQIKRNLEYGSFLLRGAKKFKVRKG